ncbi:ABC transporter ATP-binding protein [Actinospica robiniae]|uniref:ABC transporter ATP-binding protein n=1 Tax=Actinospica robiniae TaxID=304901 RepID=UPI00041A0C3E|nr:ABC transporter ATP-binding protein [Actinospica robiniae]
MKRADRTRRWCRLVARALALAVSVAPVAVLVQIVLSIASGLVGAAASLILRDIIDDVVRHRPTSSIAELVVLLALVGAATALLPILVQYCRSQIRRALGLTVQDRIFHAVNGFHRTDRFEDPRFLDQLRMAQQATTQGPDQAVSALFILGQSLVTITSFVLFLGSRAPLLAAAALAAGVPGLVVQLRLSAERNQVMASTSQTARRQLTARSLMSDPVAVRELRLFGLGDFFRSRVAADTATVNHAERRTDLRTVLFNAPLAILGASIAGIGLLWAADAASRGAITVGDVSVFVAALAAIQGGLATISTSAGTLNQAVGCFGYYTDIVDLADDRPAAVAGCPALVEGIELRDVWFRYSPDGPWVLKGVSMTIARGQSTAIVGLNGSGKSTLVKLLCGFHEPERGSIRWDGLDAREIDPESLRRRIGAIFQDHMRYDLTAGENVGVGDLPALDDRERVVARAVQAGVDAAVSALPSGYDTLLSRLFFVDAAPGVGPQRGVQLSGGQWQRLALARGLMRDQADLLILDEPSSGLDAEAERDVHERLRTLRDGQTNLLISHRLSAVRAAEQIYVLSEGVIIEDGDHVGLMAVGGQYARLFEAQAAGYQDTMAAAQ